MSTPIAYLHVMIWDKLFVLQITISRYIYFKIPSVQSKPLVLVVYLYIVHVLREFIKWFSVANKHEIFCISYFKKFIAQEQIDCTMSYFYFKFINFPAFSINTCFKELNWFTQLYFYQAVQCSCWYMI